MKEEIRQDGRTILSSEDGYSIRMFFNNLSGKNFSGKEYRDYVRNIAFGEWDSDRVQSNSIAMERKSGQAHFPNPEQQSGRICRQHIRLFFLAPYHFYIHELPHFPFFPGRAVPFCTVTCSDSFPVTPHIRTHHRH